MEKILNTLKAYEMVIADLKFQADTYEPKALTETLSKLDYRVTEIKTVWAKEIAEEQAQLHESMRRHPAGKGKPQESEE